MRTPPCSPGRAAGAGGRFLLRIEDIDAGRCDAGLRGRDLR